MVIPELTPELLRELGAELGSCAFDDENQLDFLKSVESCDVQAAPGNGKTTLLVAKLALLSRTWRDRDRGVCVISHTNAAREEVQKRLGAHPAAGSFLGYPHFIGTVTAFIDQFVALPYLRGLGWRVRRIDDDVFAAKAKAMIAIKPTLRASWRAKGRAFQVESWCAGLTLGDGFDQAASPERVAVRAAKGRPGAHTPSGKELEEIKASLVRLGVYRFEDMHVVARRALKETPYLAARLRARFPLAILDEAQDTNGELLGLLDTIFEGGALQRLGDQNQTLYEDDAPVGRYWAPGGTSIPLDVSRRFGSDIARFASRLTPRRPQTITTASERKSHRLLIGFDRTSIEDVIPRFAEWTAARLGEKARRADVRAVASRHNLYREKVGGRPKSLTDYHPHYRSGGGRGASASTLCGSMRAMAAKHAAGQSPVDTQAAMAAALADYLEHRGLQLDRGQRIRGAAAWTALAAMSQDHPLRVRKLLIEHVLHGRAADDPSLWERFCQALIGALPSDLRPHGPHCAFESEGAVTTDHVAEPRAQLHVGEIQVRLGSIHSVKGMTVDALLLMETEIRRGQAAADRAMDLETALPHAFGLENRDFKASDAALAAATNVFVAVTRPRDALALAVRECAVPDEMWAAASDQGWEIQRLTRG